MARIVVEEIAQRLRLLTHNPYPTHKLTGPTPAPVSPGLRPGQLVQVRTKAEIAKTLAKTGRNRGLWFDREMLPYCGTTARVKTRVERFINEKNGRMIELATDAYILEDVVCKGYRSDGRWFCPRAIYPWWREAWVQPAETDPGGAEPAAVLAQPPTEGH
jgi:hypothetical protein